MVVLAVRALVFARVVGVAGCSSAGRVVSFWNAAKVSVWSLMRSSSFLSFWALTALTSSAVVSRTRLAVSLVKGVVLST